jgi:hypothetical protein
MYGRVHSKWLFRVSFKFCIGDKLHCKKELAVFPSPAGMSLIKLFLGGNNLVFSRPERVWSVTSRLGTGKRLTLFYSVREKWRGVKWMKRFSEHFNLHKPIQIVFLNILKILGPLSKMKSCTGEFPR